MSKSISHPPRVRSHPIAEIVASHMGLMEPYLKSVEERRTAGYKAAIEAAKFYDTACAVLWDRIAQLNIEIDSLRTELRIAKEGRE